MTTTVIIKANHGWGVSVVPLTTNGAPPGLAQIVEAGAEGRFSVHSGQDLIIHEIQPDGHAQDGTGEPMLVHFRFEHLLRELQIISEPFCLLAHRIVKTLPPSAERSVCLRKLLEAKDCAVRAAAAVI